MFDFLLRFHRYSARTADRNGVMRRALLVLFAAFALAACRVDTMVHVAVRPDGSGTITVTAVADSELVSKTPGLAEDLRFADVKNAGWQVEGPTKTDAGGLQVAVTHPFASPEEATALLRTLNGADGPLHDVTVTRTATKRQVVTGLTGSLKVTNGLAAFADPDVLAAIGGSPYAKDLTALKLTPADVLTFTFTADLPGSVSPDGVSPGGISPGATGPGATGPGATGPGTVSTGSIPTQSISWNVPLDGAVTDVATTSVLDTGSNGGAWGTLATAALIALIAWVIASTGFILFVAKARRDRATRRTTV